MMRVSQIVWLEEVETLGGGVHLRRLTLLKAGGPRSCSRVNRG